MENLLTGHSGMSGLFLDIQAWPWRPFGGRFRHGRPFDWTFRHGRPVVTFSIETFRLNIQARAADP